MNLETQLRRTIRRQGKADSTANVYWHWIKQFLLFAKSKRGVTSAESPLTKLESESRIQVEHYQSFNFEFSQRCPNELAVSD